MRSDRSSDRHCCQLLLSLQLLQGIDRGMPGESSPIQNHP